MVQACQSTAWFCRRRTAACLVIAAALTSLSGCGRGTVEQGSAPSSDSPLSDPAAATPPREDAGVPPPAPMQPPPRSATGQNVDYGVLVDFTVGANSEALRVSGWSSAEENFTWTEGKSATLAARLAATDEPITFRFKAAGMIKEPELPFQPVEVFINNEKVADLQIGHTAEYRVAVPQSITSKGGLATITFRMPEAASPAALGVGPKDKRVLGIRVFNFDFSPPG